MSAVGAARPLVELLSWDTDFWGVIAARIWSETPDELTQALAECRMLGVRWASVLVAVTNTHLVDSATRAGFEMVDVRITMSTTPDCRNAEPIAPSFVEADELRQAQALVDGAFQTSRFYADTHMDRARCNDFYRTWVTNSFSGELADAIVVSRHEGTLDGLVTVRRQRDRAASLPLVVVRSDRRGAGVGARLVGDTVRWLGSEGSTRVSVSK